MKGQWNSSLSSEQIRPPQLVYLLLLLVQSLNPTVDEAPPTLLHPDTHPGIATFDRQLDLGVEVERGDIIAG